MTPEERDDLLRNAPPEEGLAAKYEHLLHAYSVQELTMEQVSREMRNTWPISERHVGEWVDMLDSREPLSEADAAEKFSKKLAEERAAKWVVGHQPRQQPSRELGRAFLSASLGVLLVLGLAYAVYVFGLYYGP